MKKKDYAHVMKNCCEDKHTEITALRVKQGTALKIVFLINFSMFFVEFISGIKAQSTALLGDSLDMLGDAFVYGFSLYVLFKSPLMKARAAQLKGGIMLLFGLGVIIEAIHKLMTGEIPTYQTMGIIGSLALVANLISLWILYAHRDDDINMNSTWICSRNDIIANIGILVAALLVANFNTLWPDLIIGAMIAILFLMSAFKILRDAQLEVRNFRS